MAAGSTTGDIKKGLMVFESEGDLATKLAEYTTGLSGLSGKFTAERGAFTVVISGGSLVKALRSLEKLSTFCVPIPPGHVYAINEALSAEGAADDYETCLKQLVKSGVLQKSTSTEFPKFDLMLLGMGPDGHVASLFPGHPLLNEKERWITFIKDSPKPPPERITFTFPVINSSANIALVATGSGKAGVVQKALGGENSASELLPVQMITLEDGELTWFADRAAASKL
ncbi:uncharacterized protein A4U43_C08F350 [Asparagus officinalis]|nr:uncharacterized protein A4U43_C08F350 [Asparagus officinalis]